MFYYVYKITNQINGKVYIGKRASENPENDRYMGSGKMIKAAIEKYGRKSFTKEILSIFQTDAEAAELEGLLVTKEFADREDTYNLHEGGFGGFSHINNGSKEHIDRCKRAGKLAGGTQNWTEESLNRCKEQLLKNIKAGITFGFGSKHSESTKCTMSEKKSGVNNPNYGKSWYTDGVKNYYLKPEAVRIGLTKGRIC